MTKEEAIDRIKGWNEANQNFIDHLPNGYTEKMLNYFKQNGEIYDMAIEALKENPFKVVYDFFSEYVFPCNDDLVDSPNDYYTGIFDLMARIKEKADEIDASALGGNNIYEK